MTLRAGRAPGRLVYRWLRHCERMCGDVYLEVHLPPTVPQPVWDALRALDMRCKTLDWEPHERGRAKEAKRRNVEPWQLPWIGRTRTWRGTQRYWHRAARRRWSGVERFGDRPLGRRYAQLLARLLRTAARERCPVWVRDHLREERLRNLAWS